MSTSSRSSDFYSLDDSSTLNQEHNPEEKKNVNRYFSVLVFITLSVLIVFFFILSLLFSILYFNEKKSDLEYVRMKEIRFKYCKNTNKRKCFEAEETDIWIPNIHSNGFISPPNHLFSGKEIDEVRIVYNSEKTDHVNFLFGGFFGKNKKKEEEEEEEEKEKEEEEDDDEDFDIEEIDTGFRFDPRESDFFYKCEWHCKNPSKDEDDDDEPENEGGELVFKETAATELHGQIEAYNQCTKEAERDCKSKGKQIPIGVMVFEKTDGDNYGSSSNNNEKGKNGDDDDNDNDSYFKDDYSSDYNKYLEEVEKGPQEEKDSSSDFADDFGDYLSILDDDDDEQKQDDDDDDDDDDEE